MVGWHRHGLLFDEGEFVNGKLTGRNFVSILDFSSEELLAVLDTAAQMKRGGYKEVPGPLSGKTLAMIFQKPSLRTRVSFETGMTKLGGHAIYLSPSDISLGKRETTEDIALVLSRYVDIIMGSARRTSPSPTTPSFRSRSVWRASSTTR